MKHKQQDEYEHKKPFVRNGISTPLFPALQVLGIVDYGIMDTLFPSLCCLFLSFWEQS